jgi:hypothetical protein
MLRSPFASLPFSKHHGRYTCETAVAKPEAAAIPRREGRVLLCQTFRSR